MNELDYLRKLKLLRIENRKQYLIAQPHYHPSTKNYKEFKISEIKKCIYGLWGKESGGYRWMPPFAYFYANYVWIKSENDKKEEIAMKPSIDDLEWMLFYMFSEAYGFSGFEKDDKYSCDIALIDTYEMNSIKPTTDRYKYLYSSDGNLKIYKKPQEYLHGLHSENLGKPLWYNNAKDCIILGSRGAGKSYILMGLTLWFMCLDGAKSLSKDFAEMRISANVTFGSADSVSQETFITKLGEAMNYLLTEPELGVYKTKGLDPIPFLGRHMLGQPHKDWRYRIIQNGKESGGTGTSFMPVTYSPNKKGGGTTSAAGQRVHLSIIDEVGKLQVSAISVWGNNDPLTIRTTKFGVQVFAGTSGNMELVQEAKKMFLNPSDFKMVSFPNIYENSKNDIGFFIPAFLTKRDCKDKDGNTNLDEALNYYFNRLADCITAERINNEKMNYPLVPTDMWIMKESSLLPKEEAKAVKRKLLESNLYKRRRNFVKIRWDALGKYGVMYDLIPEEKAKTLDSWYETKGSNESKNKGNKTTDTDICIYEFPEPNAPNDLYKFIGVDPYVSDDISDGESLGSVFILKNPKYISRGITGDIIVAEYTGKPHSRVEFNENVEKLLALYGNPIRSLMFESNRGDDIKEHFLKMKKESLLALSPMKYTNERMFLKQRLSYGFAVGNDIDKLQQLNDLREWLLEETTFMKDGVAEIKKNIERIPSIGLLDEIIEYDRANEKLGKANYDRISAFVGCIVARRENYNELLSRFDRKKENTHLSFLTNRFKNKK